MPHYVLGGVRRGDAGVTLVGIRPLSDHDVATITEAMRQLREFSASQGLYLAFRANLDALFTFWRDVQERFSRSGAFNEAIGHHVCVELTRHMMNFLTSYRSFLDCSKSRLRRLGRATGERQLGALLDARIAELGRRSFAFSFAWEFRNYVQHVGVPAFGLTFTSCGTAGAAPGVMHKAEVYLGRETLLRSYDWKGSRILLSRQPDRIDVLALLERLRPSIDELAALCIEANLSTARDSIAMVRALREEVEGAAPGGAPAIWEFQERPDDRAEAKIDWIPTHLLDLVASLQMDLPAFVSREPTTLA